MSFDILLHETKLAAYDDKIVHITLSLLCTTWDKVKNCLHRLVVKNQWTKPSFYSVDLLARMCLYCDRWYHYL